MANREQLKNERRKKEKLKKEMSGRRNKRAEGGTNYKKDRIMLD